MNFNQDVIQTASVIFLLAGGIITLFGVMVVYLNQKAKLKNGREKIND